MPIPNSASAGFPAQAEPDAVDITILEAANDGNGVASGLACTPGNSGVNLSVAVAAGVAYIDKIQIPVVAATVTPGTASGTNPRFDLVTVDVTGTLAVVAGTAAAAPVFPAIPATRTVLCAVWIPTSATSITAANISDKRQMVDYSLGDLTMPGSPYMTGQSLRGWRAGWAKRDVHPVNILLLGDSNTVGYWATAEEHRWATRFATLMEQADGQPHAHGYQSRYSFTNYSAAWTNNGTVTDITTSGFGYGAASIAATTGWTEATQFCDRFWLRYQNSTASGAFTISIDGTVVATIATVAGAVVGGITWDSGPLARADHTVRISATTATTPIIEGIFWFDGNGNTVGAQGTLSAADASTGHGVRVINAARFGSDAGLFAAAAGGGGTWWTDGLDRFPPDVVIMAWGTNEQDALTAPATFRTNLGTIAARINTVMAAAGQTPPAYVLISPHGTGPLDTTILPYRKAIYQAAGDIGASVIDRNALMGWLDNDIADPYGFGSNYDGSPRIVADGVLNSTTTVTSATANFQPGDVGTGIIATGIPMGTTITARASTTSITISQAATASGSGVTLNIGGTGLKHLDDPGMRVAAETTANFLLNANTPPVADVVAPIAGSRLAAISGLPRPGRLVVTGHSYSTGTGATRPDGQLENSYGWHSILRDLFGGPSYIGLGINGAVSFRKPNGFTTVLQNVTSVRTTGSASAMPNAGIYASMIGLNDLSSVVGGLINNAAGLRTWGTSMLNYILRPMQSVVIEDSDGGWTYTGAGWGSQTASTSYSGASYRGVTSHTALTSCSYVIPSWFDGNFVHLALIGANSAPTSVAIKVNGATVMTVDLSGRGNNALDSTQDISYPIRIPATAGQTVLAEVAAGGGAGGFLKLDYLALEANPRPVVLFANIARMATYGSFWANITDQMVNDFNAETKAIIAAIKAQTLATVPGDTMPELVYVDIDAAVNKQASCFYTDNTHPSARGHAIMAETFINAFVGCGARAMSVVGGGNKSLALVNGKDIGIPDILYGPHGLMLVSPNTSTTLSTLGAAMSSTGTIAHPAASTTLGYRATLVTAGSTTAASVSSTNAQWTRGNAINTFCGLFYHCRFGLLDAAYTESGASTGTIMFFGFTDQTVVTALATDDPAGNRVGLQYVSHNGGKLQTAFNYSNRDGTTESNTSTLVALTQNSIYDFFLFMSPNGLVIYYQLDNLTAGTSLMTQITANIPTNTVFMRAMAGIKSVNGVNRGLLFYRMSCRIPNAAWPDTG